MTGICEYGISYWKRENVDMIKIWTLRWGDYPALSTWAQSNHMSL